MRSDKEAGDLLSTYLLQGWVMTDEICSVDDCSYPLMRSKDGSLSFCTLHDDLPTQGASHHYTRSSSSKSTTTANANEQAAQPLQQTVVADGLDEELQRRRELREQSSKASQLIGQKMLQRWALLNEHCPNDTCYAIPLIRNPDTKQKYCVICENTILTEEELEELEKSKAVAKQQGYNKDNERGDPFSPTNKKEIEQELKQLLTQSNKSEQQVAAADAQDNLVDTTSPSKPTSRKHHRKDKHRHKKMRSTSIADSVEQARTEEHKKLKTAISSSSLSCNERMIDILTSKMEDLADLVKQTNDPCQLKDLFKSIKECAAAIKACLEAAKLLPQ